MSGMLQLRGARWCFILLAMAWFLPAIATPASALSLEDGGDLVFSIADPEDMRAIGRLSGIMPKNDLPPRVGIPPCARWAASFGISKFEAVVSGTLEGRRGRVWICAGEADSRALSKQYCEQIGMRYVTHVGAVVTCRFREQA